MGTITLWVADESKLRTVLALKAGTDAGAIQRWTCACEKLDCQSVVFYARDAKGTVWFQASATFNPKPQNSIFGIDNGEDIVTFLNDETVVVDDRIMFATWLATGLARALLEAPPHVPALMS